MSWTDDQTWEAKWWDDCTNTYSEQTKHLTYAYKMGLTTKAVNGKWPTYDVQNRSIIDIGGGPVSMLLTCLNRGKCAVLDPLDYPDWVTLRYHQSGITVYKMKGEDFDIRKNSYIYDEAWIYNTLQHVEDPKAIIENAKAHANRIRIFEWLDMPPVIGHPHTLKEDELNTWLGHKGTVEFLNENNCYGKAYYGVFDIIKV